jgi:hypothetical protein
MKAARSALRDSTPNVRSSENKMVETDQRNIERGESIKKSRIATIPIASGPTKESTPSKTKFLSAFAVNF